MRFKQKLEELDQMRDMLDDHYSKLDSWELELWYEKTDSSVDPADIVRTRKYVRYLRRYYDDEWIADRVGVGKREITRWYAGQCTPDTNHMEILRKLFESERRKREHGR
jgi:hypothetical protein